MVRGRMLLGLTVLIACAGIAPAQVLFSEDFEGAGGLAERGWTVEATPEQSEWSVEDGHLTAICHRSPYKGGRIVRQVPVVERGVLEFDCLFARDGTTDYNHLCFGLKLYGQMMAFKRYGGHLWMVYRPAEKDWYVVSDRVPLGEWTHLRVEFDIARARAEFYLGDDPDPLLIATDLAMTPEGETGELELFNYGLTKGTVAHLVDNIVLRDIEPTGEAAGTQRTRALVFRGMTSERYRALEAMQGTGALALGPERVSQYTLMARSAATLPRNKLALERVPGAATWREARWIVLEDMPAGPGEVLPGYLLDDLDRAVRDGASLLVLAGPLSLGKGAWQGTPLEAMLPVAVGGPWELRHLDAPAPLAGCEGSPAVRWYHDVTLVEGATAGALTAAGRPMVATRPLGEGSVTVFLAAPLGSAEDFAGAQPFWEWDGWPDLVRTMAGVGGGEAQ